MRKWYVSLLSLTFAATAFADPTAQTVVAPAPQQAAAAAPAPATTDAPKNPLTVDGGVDFTSGYFFRGYREEDKGLLVQPYATLSLNLPALQSFGGTDLSITPYIGTWNSINTDTTGATKSPTNWYETDLIGGVNIAKGPFTLGLLYTDYTSPAGNFADTQEIGATLAYSDTGIGGITINPHVGVYRELNRSANFKGQSPGTYFEAGIEPSKDVTIGTRTVTLSVPTVVGIGFDHYYENSSGSDTKLGYASTGLKASTPLWGSWKLTASVIYLHEFADSTVASNGGRTDQFIGTVGVGFSF